MKNAIYNQLKNSKLKPYLFKRKINQNEKIEILIWEKSYSSAFREIKQIKKDAKEKEIIELSIDQVKIINDKKERELKKLRSEIKERTFQYWKNWIDLYKRIDKDFSEGDQELNNEISTFFNKEFLKDVDLFKFLAKESKKAEIKKTSPNKKINKNKK